MLPAAAVAARNLSVSVAYVIYKYWRSGLQTESWVPPSRGNNDDVPPNSGDNGVVPPNSVVRPKSSKNDVVPSDGDLAIVEEILKNDHVFLNKIRTLDPGVLDELLKIDPVALDALLRIDPAVLRDSAELDPAIIDAICEPSEKEEGDEEADWSCSRPVTESSLVIGVPTNSGNNDVVPSNSGNNDVVHPNSGNNDVVPPDSGNNDVVPPNSGNNDVVPCPELSDRDLAILEEILKDDPVLLYEIRTHDPAVINELRKFDPAVLREMVLDSAEVDPTIIDAIRKLCLKRKEEDEQEAKGSCSGRETESENENGNETQSQERDEEISRSRHYPLRPEAPDCSSYLKTGTCKFRSNWKFNHPRTTTKNNQNYFWSGGRKDGRDGSFNPRSREPCAAPFVENFMGLPIRPGERDCPYYMRNLSCGYGLSCMFNHPDPTPAGESDPPSGSWGNADGVWAQSEAGNKDEASGWAKPAFINDNQNDSWKKPSGVDDNKRASWGKADGGSTWTKQDGDPTWNKQGEGSTWNKQDGSSAWNKPAGDSSWSKQADVTAGHESGRVGNQDNGWKRASSFGGSQSIDGVNGDQPGDFNNNQSGGNWRGGSDRGNSDRGGFRGGRGFVGRGGDREEVRGGFGRRWGFGGRGGDRGSFGGRGRSDKGGFGGRGRGRHQSGGWSNRNESIDNNSSGWSKGADGAGEGWKRDNAGGSWNQGGGSKNDWQGRNSSGWSSQSSGWNQCDVTKGIGGSGSGWNQTVEAKYTAGTQDKGTGSHNEVGRSWGNNWKSSDTSNGDQSSRWKQSTAAKEVKGNTDQDGGWNKGPSSNAHAGGWANQSSGWNNGTGSGFGGGTRESDPPSGYGNGGPASLQGASSSTAARWSAPRSLNNAPLIIPPSQGIPSRNTEHNGYQQQQVEELPERPGQPVCIYFSTTGDCEFKSNCKYHHPKYQTAVSPPCALNDKGLPLRPQQQVEELPQRPGQPVCIYFSTTGDCEFKSNCKYHHPKYQTAVSPQCALNDKGLPLRPGQNICTQYSTYGICNSGPACKFDHPSL